jgi:NTP pyrophosphatase (non-canonical NTP hydrolase)
MSKKRTILVADHLRNRFYANGVEITKSVYEQLYESGEEFAGNTGFGSELAKGSKKLTKEEAKEIVKDIESVIEQSFPDVPKFDKTKEKTNKELSYETILMEANTTDLIRQWAKDRGLDKGDPSKQLVKLMEEVGELASGIAKNKREVIIDSVGDIYVVLTILSQQLGLDIETCIAYAYHQIKDRKGKKVNGIFIKEE